MAAPSISTRPSTVEEKRSKSTFTLGIMRDRETDEVPGSILLLSDVSNHNAPLGIDKAERRMSASSIAQSIQSYAMFSARSPPTEPQKKRTANGKIILEPQPEETPNDPLNWPVIRRDASLISLGLYCLVGGGMTPILAAGFTNVAQTYHVTVPQVALTTGLYMLGLGVGSVIASPTAIKFGKRPVYLVAAVTFILTAIWCALSPTYTSLVIARVFMGLAVSPVECLPSATIAEIYFLHERAYRLGIYTLLLLGGKNLVPLVSAAIIQSLGWRWVFWIVAMVVGFCGVLLFFFVPETFWDRTPRPHTSKPNRRPTLSGLRKLSSRQRSRSIPQEKDNQQNDETPTHDEPSYFETPIVASRLPTSPRSPLRRAHFSDDAETPSGVEERLSPFAVPLGVVPEFSSIGDSFQHPPILHTNTIHDLEAYPTSPISPTSPTETTPIPSITRSMLWTANHREAPERSYISTLRIWSGRFSNDNWFRIAARPFVLFAYPSILWSTVVYALSVGWLIVLSESVSTIYRSRDTYNFTALQTGLVYISPFVGGILGTAVAGKVSDVVVRAMAKANGGIYEPEFRLIMGAPVALFTTIGLMGYGWAAQERDRWIVPTVFFGIISFGCSLGSTTAITFAVDSYRQYAGEALVTLNFSKNVFHGLVFSLFFNKWLDADGSKAVFLALGGIQLGCLLFTIPMYIFGKRARMWTVRKKMMAGLER